MLTITALTPPESPAATAQSTSAPLRVGLVQHRWHEDRSDLHTELSEGIAAERNMLLGRLERARREDTA